MQIGSKHRKNHALAGEAEEVVRGVKQEHAVGRIAFELGESTLSLQESDGPEVEGVHSAVFEKVKECCKYVDR